MQYEITIKGDEWKQIKHLPIEEQAEFVKPKCELLMPGYGIEVTAFSNIYPFEVGRIFYFNLRDKNMYTHNAMPKKISFKNSL